MKTRALRFALGLALLVLGVAVVLHVRSEVQVANGAQDDDADHDGHEHEAGDHDDEDHEDDGHEEHEEGVIHLTEEQLANIRLEAVQVRRGSLTRTMELPGEVQWNTDRLVHVTPRVTGIVSSVAKTLGDVVAEGDLLCSLDSREMGEAKMEYLADLRRFAVSEAAFQRAKTVHDNTRKLLEILARDPAPAEVLDEVADLPVGNNKNRLLTAHTRLHVNERSYKRFKALLEKKIASEADLLSAQGAYEISRVDYLSTREEITFDLELSFLKAERDFNLARTELRNAERALHILGVSIKETTELRDAGDLPGRDIAASSLYSPIGGVIVERHITKGELVEPGTRLYTIADPSTVWVMGRVYERDLRRLKIGQKAVVGLDAFPGEHFEGAIDYIGSQLDPGTRTVAARVRLENALRRFRPGMFGRLTVFVEHDKDTHSMAFLIPLGALQRAKDGYVVFREHEHGEYEQVFVQVLERSNEFAEITGPLEPGDRIVAGDLFVLKSEVGKAKMGGGHSH